MRKLKYNLLFPVIEKTDMVETGKPWLTMSSGNYVLSLKIWPTF